MQDPRSAHTPPCAAMLHHKDLWSYRVGGFGRWGTGLTGSRQGERGSLPACQHLQKPSAFLHLAMGSMVCMAEGNATLSPGRLPSAGSIPVWNTGVPGG